MAKVTCVDALVYWGGNTLPERNEASISWSTDVATAKYLCCLVSAQRF